MSDLDQMQNTAVEAAYTPARSTQHEQQQEQAFPSATPASRGTSPSPKGEQKDTSMSYQRSTASHITVSTSRSVHVSAGARDGVAASSSAAPADVSAPTTPPELQMVADLKSELFHASRQLAHARQQARTQEEACGELRQQCQGLDVEKQTLTLQLQEAQDRLQARQIRLDEHRREAAVASLRVVSLTAERDELAVKMQEAWDRVAELSDVLRSRDAEVAKLQAENVEARHAKELAMRQQADLESQLRLAQEERRTGDADARAQEAARERLTSSLNEAAQRLAGVLSDVAYDYQQSLVDPHREDGAQLLRITDDCCNDDDGGDAGNGNAAQGEGGNRPRPPHVVLSPADHAASAAATPRRTAEAARLHAEALLRNADAAVWGDAWAAYDDATPPATSARPSTSFGNENENDVHQRESGEGGTTTASTPPSCASPFSAQQTSLQRRFSISPTGVRPASQEPSATALSEQVFVRAALTPIVVAMKHVAAMLATVRHEHRRTAAEAAHFHARYTDVQQQLEAAQLTLRAQETQAGVSRGQLKQLQQQATEAEEALHQCRADDAQRRAALAGALRCREDWALIQHAVERLLVQQSELQKDLAQEQRAHKEAREIALVTGQWPVSRVVNSPEEATADVVRDNEQDRKQPVDTPNSASASRSERLDSGVAVSSSRPRQSSQAPPPLSPTPPSATTASPSSVLQFSGDSTACSNSNNTVTFAPVEPYHGFSSKPLVSHAYSAPLPVTPSPSSFHSPSSFQHPALSSGATERQRPLHSLYGGPNETSPPPPPPGQSSSPPSLPVAPSVAAKAHPAVNAVHAGTTLRNGSGLLASDVSDNGGGGGQSSMFAVEVLQVIEALDRRVSGALHRPLRS